MGQSHLGKRKFLVMLRLDITRGGLKVGGLFTRPHIHLNWGFVDIGQGKREEGVIYWRRKRKKEKKIILYIRGKRGGKRPTSRERKRTFAMSGKESSQRGEREKATGSDTITRGERTFLN